MQNFIFLTLQVLCCLLQRQIRKVHWSKVHHVDQKLINNFVHFIKPRPPSKTIALHLFHSRFTRLVRLAQVDALSQASAEFSSSILNTHIHRSFVSTTTTITAYRSMNEVLGALSFHSASFPFFFSLARPFSFPLMQSLPFFSFSYFSASFLP